jgi:hypothetical protein
MPTGTQERHDTDMPQLEQAQEAIGQLDLATFIEQNQTAVFRHIEQAYALSKGETDAGFLLIAESLPVSSAIIQVASPVNNFRKAQEWVSKRFPDAGAFSALSVLTLIYIVHRGYEVALNSNNQRLLELWSEILQKMKDVFASA